VSRRKHDYDLLRREYISTDISVRALCEKHGIRAWSSVNAIKTKEGWDRDREDYRQQMSGREVEALVEARIRMVADIHGELLLAVRHAIRRFIADVSKEADAQAVSARDLMGLIDKFLLLTGQPTARTENRNFDSHDFGGLLAGAPPELLRELAELARENGAGAKSVGRGPLIILEGTRTA
jgi:hypothetical protein